MVNQTPGQSGYEYEWQNPSLKTFDFGKVFGRAFKGIFADPKSLIIGLIVVCLFTAALSVGTAEMTKSMIADPTSLESGSFLGFTFGTNFISLLVAVWFQLIIIHTSYAMFTHDPSVGAKPIAKAFRYMFPMFIIALIYTIVCILGFYALFIGFVFVWPGWALAGPIYVFERKGIFGSLGRAWSLSKGNKRWIFLLLSVLGLIAMVVYSVSSGVMMTLGGFNMFDPGSMTNFDPLAPTMIIATALSAVASYFIYALFASAITAAYLEIKENKEGGATLGDVFS